MQMQDAAALIGKAPLYADKTARPARTEPPCTDRAARLTARGSPFALLRSFGRGGVFVSAGFLRVFCL